MEKYADYISYMLTISTAHIKEDTFNAMIRGETYATVYPVEAYDCVYGCFVLAQGYDLMMEEIPEDLKICLDFALENECDWVRFDGDAAVVEELPVYEWKN